MDGDEFFCGFIGFLLGMVAVLVFVAASNPIPQYNIDNLGESMCEEHNLEFDEFKIDEEVGIKFFCVNKSVSVEDGYLLMTK